MITADLLTAIGRVIKPHGVAGEMSIQFTVDSPADTVEAAECLIFDIDGIFVPFFPDTVRPRGSESLLVKLDGIDSDTDAAQFSGKTVFALTDRLPEDDEEDELDPDNLYAGQLAGFEAYDADTPIGTITDIDDTTENVLFIVENAEGSRILVPVADEFISGIDIDNRKIYFSLPEGILDL